MFYRLLSRFYPKNIRSSYTQLLKYLGMKTNPDVYMGVVVLISLLLSVGIAFVTNMLYPKINFFIQWIGIFVLIQVMIYLPLMMRVDKKAKEIEFMLPDALQIMSSNLKSGLTVDQALLSSVRPEFGSFAIELDQIGKEIAIGKPIEKALLDSTDRVKSAKYKKTMELLASGLRGGGEISKLLDQTSANLKHQNLVDQKVRSNVMMYIIFIFFAICFGSPILYGLSSFLVDVISNLFSNIDIPSAASDRFSIPIIQFSNATISGEFVNTYIISSILVSSVMGGLIIGSISKGKEKEGIKFIPILLLMAIVMFYLVRTIIASMMGSLIDI